MTEPIELTPFPPGGFATVANAFLNPIGWVALAALFVVVATPWSRVSTFGNVGAMTRSAYDDLEKAAQQSWAGFFVAGAPLVLFILQVVRNIALWLSWTFYLVLGPALTPGVSTSFYIAVNSLVLAGSVFHTVTEDVFWSLRWYALASFLRFLEWAAFLAAFIVALVEFVRIDTALEETATNLFLTIVLGIIVLHTTWLFLRNLAFQWGAAAINVGGGKVYEDDMITGSAASLQSINSTAAKQRAAQNAFAPKNK